eukprot:GAFH01001029.1.p1 GENE.GAFH01001029.1~~GAFH01001029.1.p1  ORF type:complete len:668 (+),score=246.91 GAFH01001029.1:279-2006(+)
MKVPEKCRLLECESDDSTPMLFSSLKATETNDLLDYIKQGYYANWILDNLPSASTSSTDEVVEFGFPLGRTDPNAPDTKAVLYNHVHITVQYNHNKKDDHSKARVVYFEVVPQSIDWLSVGDPATIIKEDTLNLTIDDPTFKTDYEKSELRHSFVSDKCQAALANPKELVIEKDKAYDRIYWSYDVEFVENPSVSWASRWDIYLKAQRVEIHWFSIIYSLLIVLFLTGMVAMIMLRILSRDVRRYNEMQNSDEAQEETGWKLVHGDVFRPPRYAGMLSVHVGTGIQLFLMALVTIFFALFGFLSPANRGGLMSAMLMFFVFSGVFAGYIAARLYKMFEGTSWKLLTLKTALLFPGIVFLLFFVMNFVIWGERSSRAVPFGTLFAILGLWFGISVPLVFLGAYFGFKHKKMDAPVRTNQIPRQVPPQVWYMKPIFTMLIGGVLPFGAVFIELFFILSNLWQRQVYYMFGFLFVVFIILIITCAEITIVMCYFQLSGENYHWWWRSFFTAGSSSLYFFFYSCFYFATQLTVTRFVSALLYFSYMLVASLLFFLLTGTIGFVSCFIFVRRIYSAIKVA